MIASQNWVHDYKISHCYKTLLCQNAAIFECHINNNNELFSRIVFATFALIIIVVIYHQACQRVV